jgi:hypothetical protein
MNMDLELGTQNKILQLLSEKPHTRPELIVASGSSPEKVVAALFHLRKARFLWIDENTSKYHLTPEGKSAAPPKFVRNLELYRPEPGTKHIVGMKGKFDYAQPLRGGLAFLYDALLRPMRMGDWAIAANMEIKPASFYIAKLMKLGIVVKNEATGEYSRAMDMKIEEPEPPKPVLTPAEPGDPIIEQVKKANPPQYMISNFSKANISLDEAMEELLNRFSPMEIMICALARFEDEFKKLNNLKNSLMSAMPGRQHGN